MATATDDVDAIRQQMAQIRHELHEDVRGVVAGAEAAFDVLALVRKYPWPSLALGLVVGYLIVPKRREVTVTAVAAEPRRVPPAKAEKEKKRAGLFGMLFGLVGPIVLRAAQSYASQYVENWIAQQGVLGPLAGGPGGPQEAGRRGPDGPGRGPAGGAGGGPAWPGAPWMPGR